jgi:inner membrane protein
MLSNVWNWAILGIVLIGLEMITGTFYILCFGISALFVSVFVNYFEITFNIQLLLYILFSIVILLLWHFGFKKKKTDLLVGQSVDDTIGKVGYIVIKVSPEITGNITFNVPVMGSKSWMAVSDEELNVDDFARVIGIEGNYLRVVKNS